MSNAMKPIDLKPEHADKGVGNVYLKKAVRGKYVQQADKYLSMITDEELVVIMEMTKKTAFEYTLPEDLKIKQQAWATQFKGSKPSVALVNGHAMIRSIYDTYGIPKNMKFTWGAVVQSFANRLIPAVAGATTASPVAGSFHYCRALYMLMNGEQVLKYATMRNEACIDVVIALNTIVKDMTPTMTRKEIYNLLSPKYEEIAKQFDAVDRVKVNEIDFAMRAKSLFDYKIPPTDLLAKTLAAYFVDFRFVLQSKSFKFHGITQALKEYVKEHIVRVCKISGLVVTGMIDFSPRPETEASWRATYFANAKMIKAICGVLRAMLKGGAAPPNLGQNAKRDYLAYRVTV